MFPSILSQGKLFLVLDCYCKVIPGGEGQKRRTLTVKLVFPREIRSLGSPGVLMIIGKEKIPVSDLAGMNLRDSLSTKKTLYRVLVVLHIFTVTPNIVKKG